MRNTAALTNDELDLAIERNYRSTTKSLSLHEDTEGLWAEFDARALDGKIVIEE